MEKKLGVLHFGGNNLCVECLTCSTISAYVEILVLNTLY